uniref:Transient receptor potential cation channel, subfamily V, member 6 n=1 Tax=Gadus morhua TaxID=8049 RepID=A0A8C4Z0F4_GADMO
MAPCLARSLGFRLQNKKGWTEMLDETFLLCTKRTNNIPLFFAAKKNSAGCVKKLLGCASTNIFERGALGETALHIAVMNDNVDAAVALMDGAPELINEPMTSELMQGVTPLHIAVVNQNITLVGQLIARGGDVATPRVTGLYFKKRPGGLVYYDEHILSFATCMGNECIMTMLMDAGASTRVQDSRGNTVLHILVMQPNKTNACQAMDLILSRDVELDHSLPLDMVPNYKELTPFELAAKEGNVVVRGVGHGQGGQREDKSNTNKQKHKFKQRAKKSNKKEIRTRLDSTQLAFLAFPPRKHGIWYLKWLLFLVLPHSRFQAAEPMLKGDVGRRPATDWPESVTKSRERHGNHESYATYEDSLWLVGEILSVLGAILILLLEVNIFGDLTKFMWLSFIVLIGCLVAAAALWMVYMTLDPESIPAYRSFPITLFSQFDDTHWRVAQERDELWRTQVVATTLMLERRLPRCLSGTPTDLLAAVEDRNDLMVQKMRRYINAFAKDGEGGAAEREEGEKGGESGGGPELRSNKQRRGFNKAHAGWQAIRRSALSMDLEPEYEEEEQEVQDIRFV